MYDPSMRGLLRDADPAPGGGADPAAPPPFDAAAEITKLSGTFQTMFNRFDKTLKDQNKVITELKAAREIPPPTLEPEPTTQKAIPPEIATEMKKMRETITRLETETAGEKSKREAAENASRETSRVTTVKDVLNAIPFRDQTTREDAFHMVAGRVKYNDDGELVAEADGQSITAKAFIESYFNDKGRAHYLAARGTNGSGARPAGGTSGGFNVNEFRTAAELTVLREKSPLDHAAYIANLGNLASQKR